MEQLKVKVVLGTTREGRFSEHSANWITGLLKAKPNLDVELIDLNDYVFPSYEKPQSPGMLMGKHDGELEQKWAAKIAEADAIVMVTPEYNRAIPGVLKNAIDQLYYEWNKKPLGVVSHGTLGGARAVEALRTMAVELQMASVRQGVHIMSPWTLVDEKNQLKEGALDSYAGAAENLIEQLVWWGTALKTARAK